MNRLGRFAELLQNSDRASERVDSPSSLPSPAYTEARSGAPVLMQYCYCGGKYRLAWDRYSNHCLFGHRATEEHRPVLKGRHEKVAE